MTNTTTRPTAPAPRRRVMQADIGALAANVRRVVLDDFVRECPPDLQELINIERQRRSHIEVE
jgi:hypothetical protein